MEELLEKKNSLEESFVMIKPDGFEKRVFKEVMERFLEEGLSIENIIITTLDEDNILLSKLAFKFFIFSIKSPLTKSYHYNFFCQIVTICVIINSGW